MVKPLDRSATEEKMTVTGGKSLDTAHNGYSRPHLTSHCIVVHCLLL